MQTGPRILRRLCGIACLALALPCSAAAGKPDAVVAADGSGEFRTVQEAVNKAPQKTSARHPWTILVRAGTYNELVYVQREKRFVKIVGEGADKTRITYNLNAAAKGPDGLELGTFRTPTMTVDADDFTAENLCVENSFGRGSQALALRVDGDRAAFRDCKFVGYQDTILLNRGRQYFARCTIEGAVDFIFGGATAYFDKCDIVCTGGGYITAASTPADAPFGFVFADCRISADMPDTKVYLGRPWRDYAAVAFLRTEMSGAVRPAGWHNWDKPERESTARYAEFACTGPGSSREGRVSWARVLPEKEAAGISPASVLAGQDRWQPTTP